MFQDDTLSKLTDVSEVSKKRVFLWRQIANDHDASLLTNSQTEMCFQSMLETREVHVLS